MTILDLARGLVESSQPPSSIEIGNSPTFDEDLFDVPPGD